MRVLITGATGLIGSSVADALLARGDEVVGLTRNVEKARPKNPTVNWHAWQPTSERPPPEALEGVDGVVNLIGEEINQRLTDEAKRRIRESRVTAARNLIQGMQTTEGKPSVFIGQSAIGYYGDQGAKIVDEESQPGEGFAAELPAEWEAAEREAEKLGIRTVILRTGLVLTKHGGLIKQLLLPFKLGLGGPLGSGDQYMSWIHLDDEVGIILWALDNEQVSGVVNATAPNPVTNKEFSKAFGRALGRPTVIPTPKFAVAALRGRRARRHGVRRRAGAAAPRDRPGVRVPLYRHRPRDGGCAEMKLEGVHHITAITGKAQQNVDFYAGTLGLRMVKKTVNQDDPTVYHLFYADEQGDAGSDITFFEYPGALPGRAGGGHDPHRRLAGRLGGGA